MTRRQFEALLTDLGYRPDRQSKHTIWSDQDGREVTLSQGRRGHDQVPFWQVDRLRKRHPDHPALQRHPGAGKGQHRSRGERHRQRSAARLRAVEPPSRPRRAPRDTGCVQCGRRWLSDLSPIGRVCPACGGEIAIGSADPREFRFPRAA